MDAILIVGFATTAVTGSIGMALNSATEGIMDAAQETAGAAKDMARKAVQSSLEVMTEASKFHRSIISYSLQIPNQLSPYQMQSRALNSITKLNIPGVEMKNFTNVTRTIEKLATPLNANLPMPELRYGLKPLKAITNIGFTERVIKSLSGILLSTPLMATSAIPKLPSPMAIGTALISELKEMISSAVPIKFPSISFVEPLLQVYTVYPKLMLAPMKIGKDLFGIVSDKLDLTKQTLFDLVSELIEFGNLVSALINGVTEEILPVIYDVRGTVKQLFRNMSILRIPAIPGVDSLGINFPGYPGSSEISLTWTVSYVDRIVKDIPIIGSFVQYVTRYISRSATILPSIPQIPQFPMFPGLQSFPGYSFAPPVEI